MNGSGFLIVLMMVAFVALIIAITTGPDRRNDSEE